MIARPKTGRVHDLHPDRLRNVYKFPLEGLHIKRNSKLTVLGRVVYVFVSAIATSAAILAVSYALGGLPLAAPTCTAQAAMQLPKPLVQSVNTIEAERNIATATSPEFITNLMSRPLRGGGTAEAFANFDPGYCGFNGNINDFNASISDGYIPLDRVVLIRHGSQTEGELSGICISNTVPTAKMANHVIVMTIRCDRLYPESTWTQPNPKLRPLP